MVPVFKKKNKHLNWGHLSQSSSIPNLCIKNNKHCYGVKKRISSLVSKNKEDKEKFLKYFEIK